MCVCVEFNHIFASTIAIIIIFVLYEMAKIYILHVPAHYWISENQCLCLLFFGSILFAHVLHPCDVAGCCGASQLKSEKQRERYSAYSPRF